MTKQSHDDTREAAASTAAQTIRRMFDPHAKKMVAAFIFGSVAGGTETTQSDIDLMVIADGLDYAFRLSCEVQAPARGLDRCGTGSTSGWANDSA